MSQVEQMDDALKEQIGKAMGRIPQGLWILTAQFEERRTGMLVSWVQQASFEPPMIAASIGKGRPIMPLISDSHTFGLCQLTNDNKAILRKFAGKLDMNEDPFLGFELTNNTVTGVPILAGAMSYLECRMTTHLDIEGDHDLFIAQVVGGGFNEGEPAIHLRDSGFNY